jgi:CRISPR/Cas system-associated exonuclease Cas4 (RecB family)
MSNLEQLIDQYHERINANEQPRAYLGCSQAGIRCERRIWLMFRWAVQDRPSGRTLRMFRRGREEERLVLEDLRAIGCVITDCQREVVLTPYIKGHVDGIITSGLPGHEDEQFVLEIKTFSSNAFTQVMRKGVKEARHDHWVQMQLYMLGLQIPQALYFAVCKDDDRLYTEIVRLDVERAQYILAKLDRLTMENRLPPPISRDPTWWECKGCPAYSFCHEQAPVTERNCRTCAHGAPTLTGLSATPWECRYEPVSPQELTVQQQRQGCECYMPMREFTDQGWR